MARSTLTSKLLGLARRQGGVITWSEAKGAGASDRLIRDLVETGILRRKFRGVYVLAGVPDDHVTALRCALAVGGPGAVASHGSAAWLQGLVQTQPAWPEVTALGNRATKHRGIRMHSSLVPVPAHRYRGIACTTPLRTLVDLAADVSVSDLDQAIDKALSLGLVRLDDLRVQVAGETRRGQGRLRSAVERRGLLGGPSPSVLESRMARVLIRSKLQCLKAEVVAGADGRYRIDYACTDVKLAIEAYGFAWHHTPEQVAYDLERQARLTGEGWTVLAFTWLQIEQDPDRVAAEIATAHARLTPLSHSA